MNKMMPFFEVSGLSMIEVKNNANSEVLPWVHCVYIKTVSNDEIGFTALDRNVNGYIDYSPSVGIDATSVKRVSAIDSNNLDIKGLIDNNLITNLDIRGGKFSNATVKVLIVNFVTGQDVKVLTAGKWGQVRATSQSWTLSIRTNLDILNQSVHQSLSRQCRWKFGDSRCEFNKSIVTATGTVSAVNVDNNNGRFNMINVSNFPLPINIQYKIYDYRFGSGYAEFTSGSNKDFKIKINYVLFNSNNGEVGVQLLEAPPYTIAVNDTVKLHPGCDKTIMMCKDNYGNQANFGGIAVGNHFFPDKEKLKKS